MFKHLRESLYIILIDRVSPDKRILQENFWNHRIFRIKDTLHTFQIYISSWELQDSWDISSTHDWFLYVGYSHSIRYQKGAIRIETNSFWFHCDTILTFRVALHSRRCSVSFSCFRIRFFSLLCHDNNVIPAVTRRSICYRSEREEFVLLNYSKRY